MYLITSPPDLNPTGAEGVTAAKETAQRGTKALARAIATIYSQGGVRAFWVGNGLNTAKIFPVSGCRYLFERWLSHDDDRNLLLNSWDMRPQ